MSVEIRELTMIEKDKKSGELKEISKEIQYRDRDWFYSSSGKLTRDKWSEWKPISQETIMTYKE